MGLPSEILGIETFLFTVMVVVLLAIVVLFAFIANYALKLRKKVIIKDEKISELNRQKLVLESKNRDIIDSLIYAQRIQEAMLPSEEFMKRLFAETFIFFRPRDIVSGDFYWVLEKNKKVFLVVADCTGHGVPGALMSMIGMEILEKTIQGSNIENPSEILAKLDHSLEKTFNRKRYEGSVIRDGMDLSLCVIDTDNSRLEYAGAFLSLYLLRNNNLIEFKGDKLVLGMNSNHYNYTTHVVQLEKNDTFYLFSDGYADQFGGTGNKKFMYRRFRYLLTKINRFPMVDQKVILEDNIRTWMGANTQVDDMMVIGFRPLPAND